MRENNNNKAEGESCLECGRGVLKLAYTGCTQQPCSLCKDATLYCPQCGWEEKH